MRQMRPNLTADSHGERPGCMELYTEDVELKDALSKMTISTRVGKIDEFSHGNFQAYNSNFESMLSGEEIRTEMLSILESGNCVWIKGTIDSRTGRAVASILELFRPRKR